MLALIIAFSLLLAPLPQSEAPPVCPTYYDLGYDIELNHAAIVAGNLGRVMVVSGKELALVVAQVVDYRNRRYGAPVAVDGWPAGPPLTLWLPVPPEADTELAERPAAVLVRVWRNGDAVDQPVCRVALLLREARWYVPLAQQESP